jgi:glycosyltransferase involved in cell wall biosynthesis
MGGVTALYELANGLARRGHEVNVFHGPFWGRRISSLDELAWFSFDPGVRHHLVDDTRDPSLPDADIIFGTESPARMGLPVLIVQGFEMFPEETERRAFRTPCLKVCVASWLLEAGARYGTPPEQLVHVPMGIDHDTFRQTRPLDHRPVHVAMLYNPHPAKGWKTGYAALRRARARVPDMEAIVFGAEPPPEPLPPWITFVTAPQPEDLVADVYNRCRIFVQPSLYEGFGFTAVEAMACGCALVSTDNGGSRDYAVDDETALVCEPGTAGPLARRIEALLLDDGLRLRLADNGVRHVQRFRWERSAELLEHHLERYLADPAVFQRPPADV